MPEGERRRRVAPAPAGTVNTRGGKAGTMPYPEPGPLDYWRIMKFLVRWRIRRLIKQIRRKAGKMSTKNPRQDPEPCPRCLEAGINIPMRAVGEWNICPVCGHEWRQTLTDPRD